MHDAVVERSSWRAGVTRQQWRSLIAANLGWLFDGFETYALILTAAVVLKRLDPARPASQVAFLTGATIAVTLLGWGFGGILGGIFADYFGRRRALLTSMVLYAAFTGLTAASWSWTSFLVLRFITGFALGSEWGTGTSLVAETWPPRPGQGRRAHAVRPRAGLLHRVGLLALHLAARARTRGVHVPHRGAAGRVRAVAAQVRAGVRELDGDGADTSCASSSRNQGPGGHRTRLTLQSFTRLTLRQIMIDPKLRKLTILGSLMSLVTTLGWWGISTWVPAYVASVAAHNGASGQRRGPVRPG